MHRIPKPPPLGDEFARQFSDPSVVAAYHLRPPYPPAVFDILFELLQDRPRVVLDAGCGTGDLARPLAPLVERVDAVDRSSRMLARGRELLGGTANGLGWVHGHVEDAPLCPPYGLVTCGESLHWMEWAVALPRFASLLVEGGYVAIIGRKLEPAPWTDAAWQVGGRYATNRASSDYDLVAELQNRGLFRLEGVRQTEPIPFRQSLADFVESYHSRERPLRERLAPEAAAAFDADMHAVVAPFRIGGALDLQVRGTVVWGLPLRV